MGLLENFKKIVFSKNQVETERRKKLDKKKADENDKEEKIHKAVEILTPIAKEGVANWYKLSFEKRTEIWKDFKNKIESKNQEFLESLASKRNFKGHTLEDDDFIEACERMIIEEGKLSEKIFNSNEYIKYLNLKKRINKNSTDTNFYPREAAKKLFSGKSDGVSSSERGIGQDAVIDYLRKIWEITIEKKVTNSF